MSLINDTIFPDILIKFEKTNRLNSDNVVLAGVFVEVRNTFYGNIIGLGGARSKNDFSWVGTDQGCNLFTSMLHRLLRLPAISVRSTVWISKIIEHVRQHGINNAWVLKNPQILAKYHVLGQTIGVVA